MKKICYFECFAGASGDMLLGTLLGAGIDKDWFIKELKKIQDINDTYKLIISKVVKKGISATDVNVKLAHHEHHHRGLDEISRIINSSDIDSKAKELAIKIFTTLAKAEAKVHGTDINKIHFHEVGAIDAIVDIVGFSILYTKLGIDKAIVSPVNVGSGFVKVAHGVLPVPAPATLEILNSSGWPIENAVNIECESLTPTGAAILSTIKSEFGKFPDFSKIDSVSYGSGKKDFEKIANVIRLTIGETQESLITNDSVWILETNIDDMQPELYDFIFEKLLQNGALDVFLTPIIMKKTRSANTLTVICNEKNKADLEKIIFEETTTFGIRNYKVDRMILDRELKKINVENFGEITVKIGKDGSGKIISTKPEYDDCARIARELNMPLKYVYSRIMEAVKIQN